MQDQKFIVQKIRSRYTEDTHTELDARKSPDAKVKRPANVFGDTYGSLGAIVMGAGMSLVMTDISKIIGLVPGVVVGVAGMGMALTTYPVYKQILSSRRKQFAPLILKRSENLMQ